MDQLKDIGTKVETYQTAVIAAQKAHSEMESKVTGLSEGQVKAQEDAAKSLEEIQTIKQEMDAVKKTAEYIEKAVSRMSGAGGDTEAKEMSIKAGDQMARYMRTGAALDTDVSDAVVEALVTKSFYGIPESRKESEVKTLMAGNNTNGGYFIRPERSAKMIKRIFETSPVRNVADVTTTGGDTLEMIVDDQETTTGGWVGETQSRGNTETPDIGLLTIPVHEQFAQPKATQKMLNDAGFDIEAWLSRKVVDKMTRFENTAFVTGNGSQKPIGFLSLPAWAVAGVYERNAIEQIASGDNAVITADSLKGLQNSLIEDYQNGAVWMIKRVTFEQIITLVDGQGQYLLQTQQISERDGTVLLGKQVIMADDMPVAATDSLSVIYGNFGMGYTIVDRMGFRVLRDDLTEKPFTKFYTTKRVGGAVTNFEALKILKLGT